MAKFSFETSVDIQAPKDQIYNYVADFARHTEWNHQPQQITSLTTGPARVGSQYKTEEGMPSNTPTMQKLMFSVMMPVLKMMHKYEGHTIAEITALEPNERVAWTAHLPNKQGKKLMQMHWELQMQGENGTTKVIQRCEIDPPADSPFTGMINEDQAKRAEAESMANLARLKSVVERRTN